MKIRILLLSLFLCVSIYSEFLAQQMPLVYTIENTGADTPKPPIIKYVFQFRVVN